MRRTLVVGYGNPYRRDDGVGRAVVNALRRELGQPILAPLEDGLEELGREVDSIIVHQLVPELAQLLGAYALVIFVDAHVGDVAEPLSETPIAVRPQPTSVSHHMHPGTLLDLAARLHGGAPRAVLLSLQGRDFDFGETLSAETAGLVPLAVARIRALIDATAGQPG